MPQPHPQPVERKTARSYYEDGLPDILFGCAFVLFSATFLSPGVGSMPLILVVLLLPVLTAAMERLKQRYIYPRTGQARLTQQGLPGPRLTMLASLLLALLVTLVVLVLTGSLRSPALWYRWTPIFSGVLLAGAFLHLASGTGLARYHVLSVACLLGAVPLSLYTFPGRLEGLGLHILGLGLLLLLCGAITLARFLRRYPLPQGTARVPTNIPDGSEESPHERS
jgi:hypothetical protein